MKSLNLNHRILRIALLVLLAPLGIGNVWGGTSYSTRMRTYVVPEDTGKGLVYANKSNTVSVTDDLYSDRCKTDEVAGANGKNQSFYGWAKPARGYLFNKWEGYDYWLSGNSDRNSAQNLEGTAKPQAHTGTADLIYAASWSGGNSTNAVCRTAKATWSSAPSFTVVYKKPVGGTYSVQYSYLTVNSSNKFATSNENATLTPSSEDWTPAGWEASQNGYSYAADVVTLTSSAANFEAWYENGVQKSTGSGATHSYTYPITQNANVTAVFKNAVVATPEEVSVSTNSITVAKAASVVFDVETTGTWAADASGFTVTFQSKDGPGDFAVTSKSFSEGKLTVNFTYTANDWVGTSIEMVVTPAYGTGATAVIRGIAEELIDYEACVLVGGEIQRTGSLADMLTYANTLDNTPTLQLTQNVTASATLQFKKPIVFDLNNKKLSATAVDKLILVKGSSASDKVTLTITDNSYTAAGEIALTRSAAATSVGVEIADENKLTLQKGILTVTNNTAAAQGVYISGNGTLLMQGGKAEATANSDARGVFAANGFATIMSGSIDATAGTKAYALYSAATSNVSSGVSLGAVTTTGAEAAAIYVNGGKTVLDNVTMTADAKTKYAYGAYVNAGALSVNGGSITSTAVSSDVYGISIQSGASATVQQQSVITVESTTANNVYGIQNAGTLQLTNSTINATAATNYAYAVQSKSGAVSMTIEDGTYAAVSATGETYGLLHQSGTLNANGVTFTASASGNNVYGSYLSESATLVNTTIKGETTGFAQYAYGVMANTEGKNISLTGCDIEAKSATAYAYAIRNNANMTATGCTLLAKTSNGAYAYGVYAEKGANTLTNTNATVEAYTTGAYAVNYLAGTLTVNEGTYNVEARQASASALADSEAYGVKVADGKTANMSNATFTVRGSSSSWSRNAYGVYTGTGTINSTACTYTVSASQKAYGVYGAASSTMTLQDNIISATTTSSVTAYGIYSNSMFSIKGDKVTSNAQSYDSYPLYFAASAVGIVQSGWFKALGTPGNNTQIVAPINTASNNANVKVQGGFFNDMVQLRFYVPSGYDIYGVDPDAAEHAAGYYYTVNDHVPYENVCYITEVSRGFPTLEDAFDYARNHAGTTYNILMIQPYTLPAGNYSLPSNATLVVPYKASQTKAIGATPQRRPRDMEQIAENRCLTLANGANVDVAGKIEVSAEQYVFNVGGIGYVQGPYGRIHMEEGSTITLNSGAQIYAWGYITGQGEIRVKNGAKVHEQFNIQDMKGTSDLSSNWLDNNQKTFPVNQYYIQNVEAPTKYYYGSQLLGYTGFTTSSASTSVNTANGIKLVGTSDNFFNVDTDDESSWVRKRYDPATDRIIWETNSSASLGSMNINISGYAMNTKDYILPITNNMTIHILSGKFKVTQSTVFLPGASLEIDKTATLQINAKDTKNQAMGLYLYDQAQWTTNATLPVYSPSWVNGVCPRAKEYSKMKDAAIYVKGKIEVAGAIYTTAGGAAIYSDPENAGTILFNAAAGDDKTIYKTYATTTAVTTTSAQLRNGGVNGSTFTATKGVAAAGDTYAYMDLDQNGNYEWTNLATVDECIVQDKSTSVYYAKPQDYVAITSATEDGDHLFHSVTGNRLFIQQTIEAGCQWWEVTRVGETSVYHCATNDTYYEYKNGEWQEKVVHVTFYFTDPKNDAADKKKVLEVNYGAKPDASIVSNPSKTADAAATYQFYGWKSNNTQTEYAYTAELEDAYEDMYYLPIFTSITKKYTITFKKAKDNTDVLVECFYGQSPAYDASWASSAQYDYEFTGWKAADNLVYPVGTALPVVTGATYYTAQWTNHTRSYNITWKNGDDVLEVDADVAYGTASAFNGTLPTKEADENLAYTFSGWRSSLTGSTYVNGNTPTVGGETTYEAQYSTTPRYAVTFNNYDGTQLARTIYTQGETPAYEGLPTRSRDADGYFRFIGWKNSNGDSYALDATLPAVTKKETYTAQYDYVTELYLITLNNIDGNGGSWSGKFGVGSTPFYDPDGNDIPDEPTKASADPRYTYVFTGWDPALETVTGAASYTAQFEQTDSKFTVSISVNNGEWGSVSKTSVNDVLYGQPVSVSDNTLMVGGTTITATPTAEDEQYVYRFDHWESVPAAVTGETEIQAVFTAYVATVTAGGTTTYHATVADAITTANGKTNAIVTMFKNASTTVEITISAGMTIDLNGKTISSNQAAAAGVLKINASGKTVTIKDSGTGGKIDHTANYAGGYMYGINLTAGTLNITSGTIYAWNTANNRAYGIYANGSTATITMSNGTVEAESSNSPFGLYANSIKSLTMTGGTFIANGPTSRGIYTKGTTSLTNATISASGSSSYAIFAKAGTMIINSGTYTATGTSSYAVYYEAGTVTVNGGKFSGTISELKPKTSYGTGVKLQGGYYVHETDLAANCATNYHVFDLTGEAPYNYEVAEAYTITFNNYDDTQLQSGLVKKDETPAYTGTPTKPGDEDYTYTFIGWDPEIVAATADATYTAQFSQVEKEVGTKLDIVEWTSNGNGKDSLTLNLNGIPAAGWPYTINNVEYYKDKATATAAGSTNYRVADRTLTIPYSGSADTKLTITVKDKDDNTYSRYKYIIPHVYGETAELAKTNSPARVIVVNSGTLTVVGNVTVDAIYVCPEAELVVNSGVTLTTNNLYLRTTPWKAASLTNNGTITATNAYYTRIIADNSKYFQFAIPLASDVKNVRLSNNSKCTYNTSWMLKSYDEESRANNGAVNTEAISNWDLLTTDGEGNATILASVGYEMFSNTPYYREYYFPVALPETEATEVGVSYHSGEAGPNHAGWNALCSPLMGKYSQTSRDPSERLKISQLNPDGTYQQTAPNIISPAVPFYYQATHNGTIYFNGDAMVFNAPRRAWNAYVPTQWMQLAISNLKGDKLDETSIYAHPEKFAPEYETGYDVAKQSLTGGKALIYSELPCGKLAFAAVPDSLAENRIPITVNANEEGEFLFSLMENNYLGRLQHVLLHDMQNGFVTDLLERDYSAKLNAGTNAGRFYIQCVFAAEAPAVTTGVNSVESNDDAPQKIMYKNKVYIIYQGRVYDMTGRQCELK